MSADNWALCPKCRQKAIAETEQLRATAAEAYGKVPVEEFDNLRAKADLGVTIERTFREDWESTAPRMAW